MSTALAARPETESADDSKSEPDRRLRWIYGVAISAVVVAGVVMRFISVPPLWLDEAQGVAIARMGVPGMFQGLREDGAPPLYYLLLLGWTSIFGIGAEAVRSLSGVISVATLPVFWLAGVRLGGSRKIGWLVLVLAAANPWVIRYASEGRMYSLVTLFGLLVVLAMHRAWTQPSIVSGALLAVAGAALLYTHYWALFLLAAAGVMALVELVRGARRAGVISLLGLAGAGVLFLPWLPSFIFQAQHTGTPWAERPYPTVFLGLLQEWSASGFRAAAWIALLLLPLLLLGYGASSLSAHSVEFDLRGNPETRWLAWIGGLTLIIAYAACTVQKAAYTTRYTSVIIGLLLLLAAIGLSRLPSVYMTWLTLVLTGFWLAGGLAVTKAARSQANVVANVLNAQAKPGDTIVFCPDQLGPSVTRLLQVRVERTAFPTGTDPSRVNWVDYRKRNQAASATAFAQSVASRTQSTSSIWMVATDGYRTYGDSCSQLQAGFNSLRGPGTLVIAGDKRYAESANVLRWTG